jgi:hypothetical protein
LATNSIANSDFRALLQLRCATDSHGPTFGQPSTHPRVCQREVRSLGWTCRETLADNTAGRGPPSPQQGGEAHDALSSRVASRGRLRSRAPPSGLGSHLFPPSRLRCPALPRPCPRSSQRPAKAVSHDGPPSAPSRCTGTTIPAQGSPADHFPRIPRTAGSRGRAGMPVPDPRIRNSRGVGTSRSRAQRPGPNDPFCGRLRGRGHRNAPSGDPNPVTASLPQPVRDDHLTMEHRHHWFAPARGRYAAGTTNR